MSENATTETSKVRNEDDNIFHMVDGLGKQIDNMINGEADQRKLLEEAGETIRTSNIKIKAILDEKEVIRQENITLIKELKNAKEGFNKIVKEMVIETEKTKIELEYNKQQFNELVKGLALANDKMAKAGYGAKLEESK